MSLYHYRKGHGAPLVLLHGWGMNAAVWEPLLPALSGRFELTVIELPGHGASPVSDGPDLADWAAQCLAVAPPRAHWLGWSLGGQVVLGAALAAPERVSAVSLVAATPCFVQVPGWSCAMRREIFDQFAQALGDDPNATLMRFLGLQVKGAEHARDTLKLLRAELMQRPAASDVGLQQGLELLRDTDLRTDLQRLRCPSHWLFGARDTLVPPAAQHAVHRLLPGASIEVIDGAGHAPFLSHPGPCLDVLTRAMAGAGA